MRRYPQVRFSFARRTITARTPAGMAGRPARTDRVVQRQRTSCRCQRRIVAGVTTNPRQRRVGSSRPRAAIMARSLQLIRGRVCVVAAARPVDGAGRGSRCLWRCQSGRVARSSSAASRTSGRSALPPPVDHAAAPSGSKRQVSSSARRFGHPQACPVRGSVTATPARRQVGGDRCSSAIPVRPAR